MKRLVSYVAACSSCMLLSSPAFAQDNCAILAFEGGTSIINSATSIDGDVCYTDGVTSTTNQKAEDFDGTVRVHSGSTFSFTSKNFAPSGGIIDDGSMDPFLTQEDARLKALSADLATLGATASPGSSVLDADWMLSSAINDVAVVELTEVDYNSNVLTLDGVGRFVFNITGAADFRWADSTVNLTGGATADNVIWNFTGPADIVINKATTSFAGLILAPFGTVEYHNPATFEGSIAALNIDVHSDFNMTGVAYPSTGPTPVPLPAPMLMLLGGVASIGALRRWRKA